MNTLGVNIRRLLDSQPGRFSWKQTRLFCYTPCMHYLLHLPERPWRAIQNGTKKAEGRAFRQTTPYHEMKEGDTITFVNEDTDEQLDVAVTYMHHYPDVKSMLETEGVENILSSGGTIAQGIETYHNFTRYKENIPMYGIYAIGIKPVAK